MEDKAFYRYLAPFNRRERCTSTVEDGRARTHKKICGYGSSGGAFLLDEAKQIDLYRLRACLCQNQPHFHALVGLY